MQIEKLELKQLLKKGRKRTATIDDTVVQKFEYTPIQSIGNARDVSNSVAAVLGYQQNQGNIGADGMILFLELF